MPEKKQTPFNFQEARAEQIVRLAWDIWPEWYYPVIGPEQISYMLDRMYQEECIFNQMESGQNFYVLQIGRKEAGFFSTQPGDVYRIEKLYLKKEARGLGMGRQIIQEIERQARKTGYHCLQCNVNRFNPAVRFYLYNGFIPVKEVNVPFGPFVLNDFIMEKSRPGSEKERHK
jgi:GNAT superfamily N-acetyltransferase